MDRLDCLHFLLGKALQQVNKVSKEKLSPYGITPVQFGILYFLWKKDGQFGSELGEKLQMDSATVTGLIDRLELGGFIERKAVLGDRRYRMIFLTEKGKSLEHSMSHKMDELDEELFVELDVEEVRIFKKILTSIGFEKGIKTSITE